MKTKPEQEWPFPKPPAAFVETPAPQRPPVSQIEGAQYLALAQIAASRTNPRKRFDSESMNELSESVRKYGILQPILVRPVSGRSYEFEIVAGERRFRAAAMADQIMIPAIVREMSDIEALEVQVVENLQRQDLHPIEEAEGYEALLKQPGADGNLYTVDDIAAKLGKSRAYVYGRLKLCALIPEARNAFFDNLLSASTALLVARMVPDLQVAAVKDLINADHDGEPMSYRDAVQHFRSHYMLDLKHAIFDIRCATLVPTAGDCGSCPKRTGNQSDLFADVKDADVCTDPNCFDQKKNAHWAAIRAKAEAAGKAVITGDDAHEIKYYGNDTQGNNYTKLDVKCFSDPQRRTFREILTDIGSKVVPDVVELNEGSVEVFEVVPNTALAKALVKAGIKVNDDHNDNSRADETTDQRERRLKSERENKARPLKKEYAETLLDKVRFAATQVAPTSIDFLKLMVREWFRLLFENSGTDDLAERWNMLPEEEQDPLDVANERISMMSADELSRFLLDLALGNDINPWQDPVCPATEAAAALYGIDHAELYQTLVNDVLEPPAKPRTPKGAKRKAKAEEVEA